MPFDIDVTTPQDNMLVSAFPSNERTNRTTIQNIITAEHYEGDGTHKIKFGATGSRPASPQIGNLYYDTTVSAMYICLSAGTWTQMGSGASGVTIGTIKIVAFPYSSTETFWLPCDGRSLLRTGQYAALFAKIGTRYGSADVTHFYIPNAGGCSPAGWIVGGDVDGEYKDDDTNAPKRYGAKKNPISISNMPSHDHGGVTGGKNVDINGQNIAYYGPISSGSGGNRSTPGVSADHIHSIPSQGSGTPMENRNELAMGFLIYAGA